MKTGVGKPTEGSNPSPSAKCKQRGNMLENVINGVAVIICLAVTIILLSGKGAMLVAGYNTLSEEKRDKINKSALSRFVGKVMIFVTLSFILTLVDTMWLQTDWLAQWAVIMLLGAVACALIYSWNFKRFKR